MSYNERSSLCRIHRQVTIILVSLFLFSSAHAELLLASPPRESAAAGLKQYGPLAERLSQVLGEKVTYERSKGWLFYQRDMRADKYDIVFDGPHFMSWRMKQFSHTLAAKLPGKLAFVVVVAKGAKGFYNKDISSVEDLINVPVCGLAPPNLASMTLLAQYENPVSLPKLVTKKSMGKVYKAFMDGECKAAVLRDKFYEKKVPEEERAALNVIFRSEPVANQGITLSSRVSAEQAEKIKAELTEVSVATAPTLKRFAGKAKKMLPAENAEYEAYSKLLTGVVFGWEITEK